MNTYYADLHVHIGRTQTNKPVKITASNDLTLHRILEEASDRKGMDIIGVIDCHVPEVLAELQQLIRNDLARELVRGGVQYKETTLLLGTEMEIYDENCLGPIHVLCYLPTIEHMHVMSAWMANYQKNITLSSQRTYASAREVQKQVKSLEGLFIPAHIFTPHKSLYGKGVRRSMAEVFNPALVDAVELGLSSDSAMADELEELHAYPYVSNSDAHSAAKIAREYQVLALHEKGFQNVQEALLNKDGQGIVKNYGLSPQLGKYHYEVRARLEQLKNNTSNNPHDDSHNDSLIEQDYLTNKKLERPPYIHQIPLEYIPGLGPKRLKELIKAFGSEMNVIHESTLQQLTNYVPLKVAEAILKARDGRLDLQGGGGGKYGKVIQQNSHI